ncbi:MAG TPA: dTMP kinase [Candidatus Thermoplasmatota archaeon]|nr:dTMP kinase [Candidatus Thermoplasmatota archaeon]
MTRSAGPAGAAVAGRGPPPPARRGRFITFEGIDGSGKSTAIAAVGQALASSGVALLQTREESDGASGAWVRQSIEQRMDPLATTFLFLADRAQHALAIAQALDAGRHVLCDRYEHSTLAYQGVTLRGRMPDPVGWIRRLHEPVPARPDHVLLFDVDPAQALERARARGAMAPYEKAAFLQEVREAYLRLAREDPRVHVLDASRPAADVACEAEALVRGWIKAAAPA